MMVAGRGMRGVLRRQLVAAQTRLRPGGTVDGVGRTAPRRGGVRVKDSAFLKHRMGGDFLAAGWAGGQLRGQLAGGRLACWWVAVGRGQGLDHGCAGPECYRPTLVAVEMRVAASELVSRVRRRTNHAGGVEGEAGVKVVRRMLSGKANEAPSRGEGFERIVACRDDADAERALRSLDAIARGEERASLRVERRGEERDLANGLLEGMLDDLKAQRGREPAELVAAAGAAGGLVQSQCRAAARRTGGGRVLSHPTGLGPHGGRHGGHGSRVEAEDGRRSRSRC